MGETSSASTELGWNSVDFYSYEMLIYEVDTTRRNNVAAIKVDLDNSSHKQKGFYFESCSTQTKGNFLNQLDAYGTEAPNGEI